MAVSTPFLPPLRLRLIGPTEGSRMLVNVSNGIKDYKQLQELLLVELEFAMEDPRRFTFWVRVQEDEFPLEKSWKALRDDDLVVVKARNGSLPFLDPLPIPPLLPPLLPSPSLGKPSTVIDSIFFCCLFQEKFQPLLAICAR
jgi:hypothetical protein